MLSRDGLSILPNYLPDRRLPVCPPAGLPPLLAFCSFAFGCPDCWLPRWLSCAFRVWKKKTLLLLLSLASGDSDCWPPCWEPATLDLAVFASCFHLVALSVFHFAGFASYDGAILPLASSELSVLEKMDGLVESPVDPWCCRFGVTLTWPIRRVRMAP
ncbi:hypothetical protein Nepgr_003959 [Nepenthes gracilis]|uniref:Uncharacterized protein n=1 Tax=Nepenthes gracilis TaxID=150966 RepID=A0AAD3S0H9_NEPGR|nr:hypothetical protein Nepgr_003959 [Nepenthes gracilis]